MVPGTTMENGYTIGIKVNIKRGIAVQTTGKASITNRPDITKLINNPRRNHWLARKKKRNK